MKTALSGTQANARYKNISYILGLDEVSEVPIYLGWLFVINSWSKGMVEAINFDISKTVKEIQFKC